MEVCLVSPIPALPHLICLAINTIHHLLAQKNFCKMYLRSQDEDAYFYFGL